MGQDALHIRNALRMKIHEEIEVVDPQKQMICRIEKIEKDSIRASVIKEFKIIGESPIKISLFQGIPKGDKIDFIIQKSTEMGVYEITCFESSRTVVKINTQREEKKLLRWRTIAREASMQSKRGIIPQIHKTISFKELVGMAQKSPTLVAYENASTHDLKASLQLHQNVEAMNIVIGPEGGFSSEEIEQLEKAGAEIIGLGPRVLRTETAGLALVAMIQYELGDINRRCE